MIKTKRCRLIEILESRVLLDGAGLQDPGSPPAWESVIVAFHDTVANPRRAAQGMVNGQGGQLGHVFEHGIKGFSAQLPEAAVKALSNHPQVKRIEADIVMQAFGQTIPTGVKRIGIARDAGAQLNATGPVDVDIAIIDSGIDADHPDLNVVGGQRFYTVSSGPPRDRGTQTDSNFDDDNGHGTHVAGIAAARDNDIGVVGVAPGARLWGVKVLDASGSGYLSDIIAGVDWVTANADKIEVANMSLGGQGVSQTYHEAIKASVGAGVVYVVASGNEYRDILGPDFRFGTSDDTIPAAYPEVATISAIADTDGMPGGDGPSTVYADYFGTYEDDEFADFSNFSNSDVNDRSWYLEHDSSGSPNNPVSSPGLGIDLMLPGVDIESTYRGGGYAMSSGTSMASPHAAGLAALHIAANGRASDAAGVYAIRQALINRGKAWTSDEGLQLPDPPSPNPDSPDKHVENLGWAGPINQRPVVSISSPVHGATVTDAVTVTVNATDDQGVVSVEFFVGGESIGTDSGPLGGWSFTWYPTLADEGVRTVTVVATDDLGASASDSLDVMVDNNTPPSIEINPSGTEIVHGMVALSADTSDTDGTVSKVEFFVDGNSIGLGSGVNGSWSIPWDSNSVGDGDHTVTALATDDAGESSSDSVSVTVDNVLVSSVHVADLEADAATEGKKHWIADVTIAVRDDAGGPVVGATVNGSWSGGLTGSASVVTGADGRATVSSDRIHEKSGSATWTVVGISHPSLIYAPSDNNDADGDSDGTAVTVLRLGGTLSGNAVLAVGSGNHQNSGQRLIADHLEVGASGIDADPARFVLARSALSASDTFFITSDQEDRLARKPEDEEETEGERWQSQVDALLGSELSEDLLTL